MAADEARAFWVAAPGRGEIRVEALPAPGDGDAVVRAEFSGVSRGSEALVFNGRVPRSEYQRMRAPFQRGEFPAPVKYGYASVGVVECGPAALVGRRAFVLHPHQTRYVVPVAAIFPLPETTPSARAVLTANLETAVNGVWDADLRPGQRVTVIGAGSVGCLVAWVARSTLDCDVEMVDVNPRREAIAKALGVTFRQPEHASAESESVIHASGTPDGLALAMRLAAFEATILEMSWYGDQVVPLRLGEDFHARRLTLKSSQVGTVARSRRHDWTTERRMAHALELLANPELDVLITGESAFEDLPRVMPQLAAAPGDTLCHRIVYV